MILESEGFIIEVVTSLNDGLNVSFLAEKQRRGKWSKYKDCSLYRGY